MFLTSSLVTLMLLANHNLRNKRRESFREFSIKGSNKMGWVSKLTSWRGGVGSRELVLEFSLSQQVCLNVGGILPRVERGQKNEDGGERG